MLVNGADSDHSAAIPDITGQSSSIGAIFPVGEGGCVEITCVTDIDLGHTVDFFTGFFK